jgi:hypothetical protein
MRGGRFSGTESEPFVSKKCFLHKAYNQREVVLALGFRSAGFWVAVVLFPTAQEGRIRRLGHIFGKW